MYGGLAVQETVLNHFLRGTVGKTFSYLIIIWWSCTRIVFLCWFVEQNLYKPETLGSNIFDGIDRCLNYSVKFTKIGTTLDVGFRQDSDSEFSLNRFGCDH